MNTGRATGGTSSLVCGSRGIPCLAGVVGFVEPEERDHVVLSGKSSREYESNAFPLAFFYSLLPGGQSSLTYAISP